MDTEKQRQCRHDDARLTEGRNAKSEQLLVVPTELTNRERLPGELLSGSECQRPSWTLDMKLSDLLQSHSELHIKKKTTNKKVKIFSERDTGSYSTS